ncbi:MAG: TOPRIM nucleotidyl transferase/hydrolase domain-containing protein [Actinomycetes bacterium]
MTTPVRTIRIRGFRSALDITLTPGPLTALVGEAGSGKSNLLFAIWKLLDPGAPPLEAPDTTIGSVGPIRLEADLARGRSISLAAHPEGAREERTGTPPDVLFLPAAERGAGLVPAGAVTSDEIRAALADSPSPALALMLLIEGWLHSKRRGLFLMVEEPELFLRPHAQRALYRLLREFATQGNQVVYSTHAATFLNVARLNELALVDRAPSGETTVRRPEPLPETEVFRALNEFDAERSELLLARAALLVEGRTEKLVFPFFFRALGYDADLEGISIIECGGKPNIPVIAQICNLTRIPYLVIHDRDAAPGRRPIASERAVNEAIAQVAGRERTIELARDFEWVAHLHGHRHKPERAMNWFAVNRSAVEIPKQLGDAVERVVSLARQRSVT